MSASPSRSAAPSGIAFAKNLFTLFLFYEVLTISTYPLVTHKRDAEAMRARAHLSPAAARHIDGAVPAGDRRDLGARRHARFHARRHSGRQGRRPRHRRPAGAFCLRHRQGGADAAAFLAAGGDGRADAGQRAAARGRRRQGRRVRDPEGRRLRLRHRNAGGARPVGLAHDRRRHHRDRRFARGAAPGQSEETAGLFDDLAAFLRRARRRNSRADLGRRRRHAHRRARGLQDHVVLRGRLRSTPPRT